MKSAAKTVLGIALVLVGVSGAHARPPNQAVSRVAQNSTTPTQENGNSPTAKETTDFIIQKLNSFPMDASWVRCRPASSNLYEDCRTSNNSVTINFGERWNLKVELGKEQNYYWGEDHLALLKMWGTIYALDFRDIGDVTVQKSSQSWNTNLVVTLLCSDGKTCVDTQLNTDCKDYDGDQFQIIYNRECVNLHEIHRHEASAAFYIGPFPDEAHKVKSALLHLIDLAKKSAPKEHELFE